MEPLHTSDAHVLAAVIRMERQRAGLTQAEVAAGLGLSQPAWSRVESAHSVMPAGMLLALEHVLGIPGHKLLDQARRVVIRLSDLGLEVRMGRPDEAAMAPGDALIELLMSADQWPPKTT